MKVEKRNGVVEEFEPDKIVTSISNASDEVNQPLNESDLYVVMNSVVSDLQHDGKDKVVTDDIYNTIYNDLNTLGFSGVAESYKQGTGRE